MAFVREWADAFLLPTHSGSECSREPHADIGHFFLGHRVVNPRIEKHQQEMDDASA
jgi:hypothetical protein